MLVLLSTVIICQVCIPAASAQSLKTFNYLFDISEVRDIVASHDGGVSYFGTSAGRFHATLNSAPISIFCLDVTHIIAWGDTYMANVQYHLTDAAGPLSGGYYQGGLASVLVNGDFTTVSTREAQVRSAQATYLADTYLDASAGDFATGGSGVFGKTLRQSSLPSGTLSRTGTNHGTATAPPPVSSCWTTPPIQGLVTS
jgi:hypothetical protein